MYHAFSRMASIASALVHESRATDNPCRTGMPSTLSSVLRLDFDLLPRNRDFVPSFAKRAIASGDDLADPSCPMFARNGRHCAISVRSLTFLESFSAPRRLIDTFPDAHAFNEVGFAPAVTLRRPSVINGFREDRRCVVVGAVAGHVGRFGCDFAYGLGAHYFAYGSSSSILFFPRPSTRPGDRGVPNLIENSALRSVGPSVALHGPRSFSIPRHKGAGAFSSEL